MVAASGVIERSVPDSSDSKRCPMGYASVMVYVEDADIAESRIVLACDLAKLFEARLVGVSASFPIPPVVDVFAALGAVASPS
jgi:hypothetical protein